MSGSQKMAGLAIAAALCLNFAGATGSRAATQAAAAQDAAAAKPQYTMAEYNAYQAAAAEKSPAQQVKSLDDFVSKYPNSALMIYIYPALLPGLQPTQELSQSNRLRRQAGGHGRQG